LSNNGQGVNHAGTRQPGVSVLDTHEYHPLVMPELERWMAHLAARLRHVRVLNGDWARTVTTGAAWTLPVRMGDKGAAGVFLDPPYDPEMRGKALYATDAAEPGGDEHVARRVNRWCANLDPDERKWRVVLAGYDDEHANLEALGWSVHEWHTTGYLTSTNGASLQGSQGGRERLWASPHCLTPGAAPEPEPTLFD